MNRMARFLFDTNTPMWRYSLVTFVLVILPSIAIMALLIASFHLAHIDVTRFTPPQTSTSVAGFFGTVFFAPIVETYILAVLITILSSFIQNKFHVAIVSGLLWGIGHAAFGLLWFFAPAWIFFVLTCSYMAWREKSFKHAYFAAFIPHALNNATAVIAVYLGRHA